MENLNDLKPMKIERLQKSIDEINLKIIKLTEKRDELKTELEDAQKTEILAIIASQYKTTGEIAEFIKMAKSGGFKVDLVKQSQETAQILNVDPIGEIRQVRKEMPNDFLVN